MSGQAIPSSHHTGTAAASKPNIYFVVPPHLPRPKLASSLGLAASCSCGSHHQDAEVMSASLPCYNVAFILFMAVMCAPSSLSGLGVSRRHSGCSANPASY